MTAPFTIPALLAWCERHIDGFAGPLTLEQFAGGQSNPTYLMTTPAHRYVLRKKPAGALLKSAHAVEREYRVMRALRDTPVPVPYVHALCEDDSVIGTPFFVMDHVDGRILWNPALPDFTPEARRSLYEAQCDALAALHSVDLAAIGLSDYGRPGSYFARQIARWTEQYRASETGTLPDMDALIAWLGTHTPADDGRVALVHGDYRIDNMIVASDTPTLLAILDWELSTLGHPLADLAYQCMQWRLPNEGVFIGLGGIDRPALGIPTEKAYVARYCRLMGWDGIPDWRFALAFSFFRIAAILQGIKKRTLEGTAANPERGRAMGELVPMLAAMGLSVAEHGA